MTRAQGSLLALADDAIDPSRAMPATLVQGDAVEMLRRVPDGSIDCIITDPAYESLEKHRAKGTTTRLKKSDASSNEWFAIFPNKRFPALFAEYFRVLRADSHLYMYCDQETALVTVPMLMAARFKVWKALIWDKRQIGMGYHYRSRHELIVFAEKGKRKLRNLGMPDIIECAPVRNGYPTEKPEAVSGVLIEQSTSVDEVVLDTFCGSGSVGAAAVARGRRFVGIDLDITTARRRLGV